MRIEFREEHWGRMKWFVAECAEPGCSIPEGSYVTARRAKLVEDYHLWVKHRPKGQRREEAMKQIIKKRDRTPKKKNNAEA